MIKAQLIQASVNTHTGSPIFTFKVSYPRASWLRFFKVFDRWLQTEHFITVESLAEVINKVLTDDIADGTSYGALISLVDDQIFFARRIFSAVQSGGRISVHDIQKAGELFGDRFQKVLKQYKPGEQHNPLDMREHTAEATYLGWERFDSR